MHLLYKTNRIHVAWVLYDITNVVKYQCASLFLPHFDVICDFLLNKRRATCKLFFKLTSIKCSLLLFSVFHFLSQNDTDISSALTQLFNGYQNF